MAGAAATASTSPGTVDTDTDTGTNTDQSATQKKGVWLVRGTISLLLVDALVSTLLMSSILPWVRHQEDDNDDNNDNDNNDNNDNDHRYSFSGSLLDLLVLSVCRVATGLLACAVSYYRGTVRDDYPFPVVHPNGTKKTRDELEEEALEQSVGTWVLRCVRRAAFPHELLCLTTALVAVAKCLVRLELEIGKLRDREEAHLFFWLAFAYAAVVAVVEMIHLDATCVVLGKWGSTWTWTSTPPPRIVRRISSHLSLPLLANDGLLSRDASSEGEGESETTESDEEGRSTSEASSSCDDHGSGSGSGSGIGRFHNKFGNKFRFQQHSIQGPVGKIEVVLDDDDDNNNNNEDPQTELPNTEAEGEADGEGHEQKTDPPTEKADENENENKNNDDEGEGEGGDDDDDGGEIYAVKEAIADKPPTDPHGKQLWLEAKKKKAAEAITEIQNRKQKHTHTIANLDCKAYGGPSEQDAEEMVYWEDIPEDALHMSPFHVNHPENQKGNQNQNGDGKGDRDGDGKQVQSITQFLTFEPDQGGWNNIRMAMETVLALAFAMGRTLVLPPHQGMYLIDKGGDHQNNKFSFDHFFHMESISAEHIGLDIITTKEFLERCVRGEIVNANGQPIHPPDGRTDWDGMPHVELKRLTLWMRKISGQNLVDFVPEECIVSFPASNSEEDAEELAALPARIAASPEGFPPYEAYIGKPTPVDAPPIERLKEMNGDRAKLCLYTPDIQKKQWVHFPVGMKTSSGDETRLLVHFYAFLFFQDWKQDLWMKRFVRDHVRYIDEIQCAAARVVAKLRQRISDRTKGASNRFDTVHVRRGDFQFKETRVDADVILIQLKRVLDRNTTLYVATDERQKEFFKPLMDYFADVVFLDDFIETELQGINTNYFGMIDQLLASRGDIFFGCWFSTFTGYINRLRGYHADDHETPGYEQGIVPSYYYVMPDRFDHMQEFWPIKKQFYAREFPASWRLIDSSI